jgi:hypothetical protein
VSPVSSVNRLGDDSAKIELSVIAHSDPTDLWAPKAFVVYSCRTAVRPAYHLRNRYEGVQTGRYSRLPVDSPAGGGRRTTRTSGSRCRTPTDVSLPVHTAVPYGGFDQRSRIHTMQLASELIRDPVTLATWHSVPT